MILFALAAAAIFSADIPDHTLTPGVVNSSVTKSMVCKPGYTAGKDVRHVTLTTKRQVFKRYGIDWALHAKYEVDHFISLELGGSNELANLWPQHYCPIHTTSNCLGAREKDVVETSLHRFICSGNLSLQEAQAIITTDWVKCYRTIKSGKVCTK